MSGKATHVILKRGKPDCWAYGGDGEYKDSVWRKYGRSRGNTVAAHMDNVHITHATGKEHVT